MRRRADLIDNYSCFLPNFTFLLNVIQLSSRMTFAQDATNSQELDAREAQSFQMSKALVH